MATEENKEEKKALLAIKNSGYRNLMREYLRGQGYSKILGFEEVDEAIAEARAFLPDLVLIDNSVKNYSNVAKAIRYRDSNRDFEILAIDTKAKEPLPDSNGLECALEKAERF